MNVVESNVGRVEIQVRVLHDMCLKRSSKYIVTGRSSQFKNYCGMVSSFARLSAMLRCDYSIQLNDPEVLQMIDAFCGF